MKKISIVMAFVAFSAMSAFAADIPVRPYAKSPIAAPVYGWSGFYIGGNVGGVSQDASGSSNFFQQGANANNIQGRSLSQSSVIGGFHGGYNWQFAPSFVLGIEADAQWMNTNSGFCRQTDVLSLACADNGRGFMTITNDTNWLSTVRGRLGWTFDRLMIYGTGGVAFGEVETSISLNCSVNGCGNQPGPFATSGAFSSVNTGWVAGGGIEWMFASNWSLRAEYLHVDLGTVAATLNLPAANCSAGGPCGGTFARAMLYDIGRVGLSYKFGGPVVARF